MCCPGPITAESMFGPRGKISPWVVELLQRAREGKVSRFSSVRVRKIAGRTMARIGGVWFDTALSVRMDIHVVPRETPLERKVRDVAPGLRETLDLGPVVVVVSDDLNALCFEKTDMPVSNENVLHKLFVKLADKKGDG